MSTRTATCLIAVGVLAIAGCTDHADVTLTFRVSSLKPPNVVCVVPADPTFKGYSGCYPVVSGIFEHVQAGSCVRGHVKDPLQPENKGKPMTNAEIVNQTACR
jgi:hypothetical protein